MESFEFDRHLASSYKSYNLIVTDTHTQFPLRPSSPVIKHVYPSLVAAVLQHSLIPSDEDSLGIDRLRFPHPDHTRTVATATAILPRHSCLYILKVRQPSSSTDLLDFGLGT